MEQKNRKKRLSGRKNLISGMGLMLLCYVGAAPFVYRQMWEQKTKAAEITAESPEMTETEAASETETVPETDAQPETKVTTEAEETTEPLPLEFVTSDASYFDDALFIGDSRTVGLDMFGKMPTADFFCTSGLSSWSILAGTRVKGKSIDDYLTTKTYGKIYIMLGINETGDLERYHKNIAELFDKVRAAQPDALIFMMANLHVSAAVSAARPSISNERLNTANQWCEELTDGQTSFYIDVNPLFDDENHCLPASRSSDGIHPGGMDYGRWSEWLFTQTITAESRPAELHNFRDALHALLDGSYVMRSSWEETGQFLYLVSPTVQIAEEENALDCITFRTADGKLVPWTASQTDLLADDWLILKRPPRQEPAEDPTEETT